MEYNIGDNMIIKDEFTCIIDSISEPLDITIKSGLMDDDELVKIGTYNNYGTEHIPARPFIGKALRNLDLSGLSDNYLINDKEQINNKIQSIGNKMDENIRNSITNMEYIDNAPSTIRKKGFNFPLVETGRMYEKINHKIVNNKGDNKNVI